MKKKVEDLTGKINVKMEYLFELDPQQKKSSFQTQKLTNHISLQSISNLNLADKNQIKKDELSEAIEIQEYTVQYEDTLLGISIKFDLKYPLLSLTSFSQPTTH